MKKIIFLLLIIALLFGCAIDTPSNTTSGQLIRGLTDSGGNGGTQPAPKPDLIISKIEASRQSIGSPAKFDYYVQNIGTADFTGKPGIGCILQNPNEGYTERYPPNYQTQTIPKGQEKLIQTCEFNIPTQQNTTTPGQYTVIGKLTTSPSVAELSTVNNTKTENFTLANATIFASTEKTNYQLNEAVSLTSPQGQQGLLAEKNTQNQQTLSLQANESPKTRSMKIVSFLDGDGARQELDISEFGENTHVITLNDRVIVMDGKENVFDSQTDKVRYIVELKEPSATQKLVQAVGEQKTRGLKELTPIERNSFAAKTKEFVATLRKGQDIAEEKISKLVKGARERTKDGLKIKEPKIVNRFQNVANVLVIENITPDEAKRIEKLPEVKRVVFSRKVTANMDVAIPLLETDKVWALTDTAGLPVTGNGMTIGIIDTGIDYTHPDLGGCTTQQFLDRQCEKVIGGYDFINNDNDPMDNSAHGTHVAGIAAGQGFPLGVAPDAKLYAIKVLHGSGDTQDAVLAGINYALDPNGDEDFSDHIDTINLSLSGGGDPDDILSMAIDNVVGAGVIAVVAAGNAGPNEKSILSPGTARKAITVGATYKQDYTTEIDPDQNPKQNHVTGFSSRGPVEWIDDSGQFQSMIKPDVVAPGANICSASRAFQAVYYCIGNNHVELAGTSMASPYVAGVATLLKQLHPNETPEQVKNRIKNTATDLGLSPNSQGAGLINPAAATGAYAELGINPGYFQELVIPTQKFAQVQKEFTLNNNTTNALTVNISSDEESHGLTFSFSEQNFTILPNSQTMITVTAIIDTDLYETNQFAKANIIFNYNQRQTEIIARFLIKEKVTVNKTLINFPPVNPTSESWHAQETIILQNIRTDRDFEYAFNSTYDLTTSTGIAGHVTLTPSQFTLRSGTSQTITFSLDIANTNELPNGTYYVLSSLSGEADDYNVEVKVDKYYERVVKFLDIPSNFYVISESKRDTAFLSNTTPDDENRIYLRFLDNNRFDIVSHYVDYPDMYDRFVFKDNLNPPETEEIEISSTEATNQVTYDNVNDASGNRIDHSRSLIQLVSKVGNSTVILNPVTYIQNRAYFSNFSEDHSIEYALINDTPFIDDGFFIALKKEGLQSDYVFETEPQKFKQIKFKNVLNSTIPCCVA